MDPEGREERRHRAIKRRFYNVTGPHLLWHIDSTHKLRDFNLSIQGAIDGGTRLCTLLRCNDNNDSYTNLINFVGACEEYMVPSRVRSDKGGENVKICEFMLRARGLGRSTFMAGRSTRNQRIERLWRDVNRDVVDYYRTLFYFFEDRLFLNLRCEKVLYVIHRLFLSRINEDLDRFRNMWNGHKLSSEGNKTPNQLVHIRREQMPGPPTYPDGDEDEDCSDDEDEGGAQFPQVDIQPLKSPLSPRQRDMFVTNVRPLSLRDDSIDYFCYSINNGLQWLDYCISLPI